MNKAGSSTGTQESTGVHMSNKSIDFFIPRLFSEKKESFKVGNDDKPCLNMCAKFCPFEGVAGGMLAVGNEEGQVIVQNVSNPQPQEHMVYSFTAGDYGVNDVAWMISGDSPAPYLVTGGASGEVSKWHFNGGGEKPTKSWSNVSSGDNFGPVTCLATNPEAPGVFVAGFANGKICIWNEHPFGKNQTIHRPHPKKSVKCWDIGEHDEAITSLFLKSSYTLISAGKGDKLVQMWDLFKPKTSTKTFPVKNTVTSFAMHPDDNLLYASCKDNSIYCFDLGTRFKCSDPLYRFVGHKVDSLCVKIIISPCGGYLASGSSDGCAYIWSTNANLLTCKAVKPAASAASSASAASAASSASAEAEGSKPKAPPPPQLNAVAKLRGHKKEVSCVAWSPDLHNVQLVTLANDSTHRIWRVRPGGSAPPSIFTKKQSTGEGHAEILDKGFEARLVQYQHLPARAKTQAKAKQAKPAVYKAAGKFQRKRAKPRNNRNKMNRMLSLMLFMGMNRNQL